MWSEMVHLLFALIYINICSVFMSRHMLCIFALNSYILYYINWKIDEDISYR